MEDRRCFLSFNCSDRLEHVDLRDDYFFDDEDEHYCKLSRDLSLYFTCRMSPLA